MLWLDVFNWVNFCFCVVSILESVIVVYVAFGGIGTVEEVAADRIDWVARRLIPGLYCICMGIVLSMQMDDGYQKDWGLPMFQGLPFDSATNGYGWVKFDWRIAIIAPLTIVGLMVVSCILETYTDVHKHLLNNTAKYMHRGFVAYQRKLREYKQKQLEKRGGGQVAPPNILDVLGDGDQEQIDERVLMRKLVEEVAALTRVLAANGGHSPNESAAPGSQAKRMTVHVESIERASATSNGSLSHVVAHGVEKDLRI